MDAALRFAFVDLDAAVSGLLGAAGATPVRRATRAALACVYEIRSAREEMGKAAYLALEKASDEGETTSALNAVRGKFTHLLEHDAAPQPAVPYPGATVLPSERLMPGINLQWRSAADIRAVAPRLAEDARFPLYESRLAGRLVYETFEIARAFLARGLAF